MKKYNIETITIKVLTEGEPYLQNQMHLSDIERDFHYGESVLHDMDFDSEQVSEDEMVRLLYEAGSEPCLFYIKKEMIDKLKDLKTEQSSLETIFVNLVKR